MDFTEYKDKHVVVTGCSSGVGLELARTLVDLGARVVGMSRRDPGIGLAEFRAVDLTSPDLVKSATEGVAGPVDALFNCAGAPAIVPSLDLVKVNFLGTRLLTKGLLGAMSKGSAIVSISSNIGLGWRARLDLIREFTATTTYEAGVAWYAEHEDVVGHGYPWSKEALTVWTMEMSESLIARGIRINTTSPGAIQTPLLEATASVYPAEVLAIVERPIGRRSQASEQVAPLLFLNSAHASYVNGADLAVDGGHSAWIALGGASH